jgi:hypothetical protein
VNTIATRSEEISTHEPCKYDPSRAVQCAYCKPTPPQHYTEAQLRALRYAIRKPNWDAPKDDFGEAARAQRQAGFDTEY